MTKDEALRLAWDALEDIGDEWGFTSQRTVPKRKEALTAIKEALAQPEQEPVACVIDGDLYFHHEIDWEDLAYQGHGVELLYTTPPQRNPLSDEEIIDHFQTNVDTGFLLSFVDGVRYAEAVHGIKGEA